MCDYSLHHVATRPAKIEDRLVTTKFHNTITRGFAAVSDPRVAVCLLPGTELAFDRDVECEAAIDPFDQRQSARKPFAGTLHLELHHGQELRNRPLAGQVLLAHAEACKILKREINAALVEVDCNILPEICQLEGGAGEVRKLLPFRIVVSAQV